ncbi:MAG TPA: M13 family metallopeptidase [Xanthomonadaceae bacterium]|jgi:putative endopeptidase|nr:M13 family metallopeptidase [Xanthomonadaceae bacterium]
MIPARHAILLAPMLLLGFHAPAEAATKAKAGKTKPVPVVSVTTACGDFYAQVDGDWLKTHPAPTEGSVSAFDAMQANARAQEQSLLDEMAHGPNDDASRALGALWTDGMNEAAVEAAGTTPLQPLFDRIANAKKGKDIAAVIADLHAAGIPVLFNFATDVDLKDFDHQFGYANQGGLGLPDPDYYNRTDAETRDLLGRYRAYIQTILQLSGTPADRVSVESGWVLSMEMQLAQSSLPLVQLRDPDTAYHPVTLAELQKAYPNLAFGNFLKTQHAEDDRISLAHTGFFAAADGMLANTPVEQWQAYLRFHVASAMAPYLSHGFQDAHFQMYDRLLGGVQQPRERAQQVMDAVDHALGATMGHAYAQRYLSPAAKDAATHVADGLRAAMKDAIDHNAWMDAPTRAAAQAKLDKLRIEVGEPSRSPSLTGLALGGGYANDMLALAAWQHRQEMDAIGKRTSERRWPVLAQVPDVSYDLMQNRIVVTAAFLQPPVFDANADAARQYGALGPLIGHQLHYAFDSKGRTIDADGQLRDWWTPLVSTAYEQRTASIIAQYDAYPVEGEVKVNGHQTRDENLADLGGVELAWAAFKAVAPDAATASPSPAAASASKSKGAHGKPTAAPVQKDVPSPAREFFEAYAQVWARNTAPATALTEATTSIQSPAKYRVDGVLANVAEFGNAYACKAGQPMEIASPVSIWR